MMRLFLLSLSLFALSCSAISVTDQLEDWKDFFQVSRSIREDMLWSLDNDYDQEICGKQSAFDINQEECSAANKQPAQVAWYTFSPTLDEQPAKEIKNTMIWVDTSGLKGPTKGGLYNAHMLYFENKTKGAGRGYTGVQVFAGSSRSRPKCLFSLWDGDLARAMPLHENCKRNCNDGTGMGTKCTLPYTFQDGIKYQIKAKERKVTAEGTIWRCTIKNLKTKETTIIGEMLLENINGESWGWLRNYSSFYEHVGCVDCDRWGAKVALVDPIADGTRRPVQVSGTINMFSTNSCKLNNISPCYKNSCKKVLFESGPGVTRKITNGQDLWE